jgi:hypothetical protein
MKGAVLYGPRDVRFVVRETVESSARRAASRSGTTMPICTLSVKVGLVGGRSGIE